MNYFERHNYLSGVTAGLAPEQVFAEEISDDRNGWSFGGGLGSLFKNPFAKVGAGLLGVAVIGGVAYVLLKR